MGTRYTLDRFEDNDLAVLEREDGQTFTLPKGWLPKNMKEGDVLKVETALELEELEPGELNAVYFERDKDATQERLERMKGIRAVLPKGPEGDITL